MFDRRESADSDLSAASVVGALSIPEAARVTAPLGAGWWPGQPVRDRLLLLVLAFCGSHNE